MNYTATSIRVIPEHAGGLGKSSVREQTEEVAGLEERFNSALTKSIEETISVVLGRNVADAFSYQLYAFLGMSTAEVPGHLNEFFKALIGSFGTGGRVLGWRIVRRLYMELGLTLTPLNVSSSDFPKEYASRVEVAKKMFLKGLKEEGAD